MAERNIGLILTVPLSKIIGIKG